MQIFNYLFSLILLSTLIACSNSNLETNTGTSILDTMSSKQIVENTNSRSSVTESSELKEDNDLSFTVIYTGNLDAMMADETNYLKGIVEEYHFDLIKPFTLSEGMNGITLKSKILIDYPIELGKEISLIEEVMMVEVNNVNKEEEAVL